MNTLLALYAVGAHPIVLLLVIILLLGLFPGWGYTASWNWGYPPYGLLIVIILLLLLFG